jgi:outer membrane lipoprotein SlyB
MFQTLFRIARLALALPFFVAAFSLGLTGCASTQGTSTGYFAVQQPQGLVKATVIAVRAVQVNHQGQGYGMPQLLGNVVGGAAGAVLSSKAKNYAVGAVASVAGSALGGYAGSRMGSTTDGQELILRREDGQMVAITQSVADGVRFSVGQQVMIIGGGRVAPIG